MTLRFFIVLIIIISIAVSLSKDDFLSDFLASISNQTGQEERLESSEILEKSLLLDILQEQENLIQEMKDAREFGDKEAIRELYHEIMRLDQRYQEEYKKYENRLSSKDSIKVSKKHHKIIKSIPKL